MASRHAIAADDLDTNVVAGADSGSPRAISGHQEGDVGAGPLGNPADIASIDLPSGNWLVLAKAVETNRGSVSHHVFCDVTKSRDETTVWLRKSGLAGDTMSIASYGLATISSGGGPVSMQCEADGAAGVVRISQVRITALKVSNPGVHLFPASASSSAPVQFWYHDAQQLPDDRLICKKVPNGNWAGHRQDPGHQLLARQARVRGLLCHQNTGSRPRDRGCRYHGIRQSRAHGQ